MTEQQNPSKGSSMAVALWVLATMAAFILLTFVVYGFSLAMGKATV